MIKKLATRLMVLGMLVGCLGFFTFSGSANKGITECENQCYDTYIYCVMDCNGREICEARCESRLTRCLYWCNAY